MVIRAARGVGDKILFAYPEIGFTARVDMLGNDWPCILDPLPGDKDSFNISPGKIDVQQCAFRQSFREDLAYSSYRKTRSFSEVKLLSGDQTKGQARNAQNGRLQGA